MSRPKALTKTPTLRDIQRFRARLAIEGEHWIWNRKKFSFWLFGRNVPARRAAWLLYKGRIPANSEIVRTCAVKACCNPEHARLIAYGQAMSSAKKVQAGWIDAETCPKGHKVTGANIRPEYYYTKTGRKRRYRCRLCSQQAQRESVRRKIGTKPENFRVPYGTREKASA